MSVASELVWDASTFLSSTSHPHEFALIILNTPILHHKLFKQVWKRSKLRYCADGGVNRLYDSFKNDPDFSSFVPDFIGGDLDSIREEVQTHYTAKGVSIFRDPDQYSTDLGKCINHLETQESSQHQPYEVVIYGGLTGRFDQTMHTIHALTKLAKSRRTKTWVVADEGVTCLLEPHQTHRISIDANLLGPTCGILPVGVSSAIVSTTGLQWNLEETETSFSMMVSSSNSITAPEVMLTTTENIVWTVEISKLF